MWRVSHRGPHSLRSRPILTFSGSQSKTLGTAIKPIFGQSVRFEIKVALGGAWVFLPYMYGDGIPGSNIPGGRY
jgi:hypothetical protein